MNEQMELCYLFHNVKHANVLSFSINRIAMPWDVAPSIAIDFSAVNHFLDFADIYLAPILPVKVCAFLFEILRCHWVLSMQIAAFYKQPSFWCQCGLLDYQCRQLGEKFVLIWYFVVLKFAKIKC